MTFGAGLVTASACFWNHTAFPPTHEVTACLHSLPFNESWRDGTASTIKSMMPSYVLKNMLTNTGPPANIKVDLDHALDEFGRRRFENDAAMWSDLSRIFLGLHDAHTVIVKPGAYSNLQYSQPFSLKVNISEGQQRFFLGGEAVKGIWEQLGDEVANWSGSEIISIDGVAPVTAISDWGDTNQFVSLDQGARFNEAISGRFMTRTVVVFDIPDAPMKYALRDAHGHSQEVSIPWTAFVRDVAKPVDISVEACLPMTSTNPLRSQRGINHVMPVVLEEQKHVETKRPHSEAWILESDTPPLSLYLSKDGSTAVMKLTSFSPDNVSSYCDHMQNAWSMLAQKKVDNLIIDVIANGGGYVCLGYDLVRLIAPDDLLTASPTKYGAPYDLKWVGELSKGLKFGDSNNSAYHQLGMDSWLDPETLEPVNLAEFLDQSHFEQRGEVANSRYTPKFYLDCATDEFEGVCELQRPNITFPRENILVLTDGTCGSTCSTFMHRLQATGTYAKVAGVGGITLAPLVTSSFAGGFTAHLSTLNSLFLDEDQIPDFPTNGGLPGFAWAEVYDKEYSAVPAQYAYHGPDLRLDFWDFNGPLDPLYDMAKKTFPGARAAVMFV